MATSKLKTRFAIMRHKLGPKGKPSYLIDKSGVSRSWLTKVSCGQAELQYEKAVLFQGITGFSAEWLMGDDVPMMAEKAMSDTIHLPLTAATRLCAELDADENADTPESNAAERMAYSGEYMVPTKVARRLERERDNARELLKQLCKSQFGTNCEFLPMEDEE